MYRVNLLRVHAAGSIARLVIRSHSFWAVLMLIPLDLFVKPLFISSLLKHVHLPYFVSWLFSIHTDI